MCSYLQLKVRSFHSDTKLLRHVWNFDGRIANQNAIFCIKKHNFEKSNVKVKSAKKKKIFFFF